MDEVKLLPCPFCGGVNIDERGWASTDSAGPACDDCGAGCGHTGQTLQENIAAWNRRANVAELQRENARLAEALRELLLGVNDIRGIEIKDYCPKEVEQAEQALAALDQENSDGREAASA